jgi:hypothetical protein
VASVACPKCGAARGDECDVGGWVHEERLDALALHYQELKKLQEWVRP